MSVEGLSVVLLAAGNSSRYGGTKLLASIEGRSMLRRAAQTVLATGAELLVVTGAHAGAITAELEGLDATLLHNADWQSGMGSSIAMAFRHLQCHPASNAALICLADQPRVSTASLQRLIDVHQREPDCVVAAEFEHTVGPPCLFPRRCYADLAALSGPRGARHLLQAEGTALRRVAMPEAGIDIDTQDDYHRLTQAGTASS